MFREFNELISKKIEGRMTEKKTEIKKDGGPDIQFIMTHSLGSLMAMNAELHRREGTDPNKLNWEE